MIELGLSKLVLIGIVALVVIGPEKLPKVARTAGSLYGRVHRYLSDIRSGLSSQINIDELRSIEKSVREAVHDIESRIGKSRSPAGHQTKSLSMQGLMADSSSEDSLPNVSFNNKARQFHLNKRVKSIPMAIRRKHRDHAAVGTFPSVSRLSRTVVSRRLSSLSLG